MALLKVDTTQIQNINVLGVIYRAQIYQLVPLG